MTNAGEVIARLRDFLVPVLVNEHDASTTLQWQPEAGWVEMKDYRGT